jgi:hypothetical protein
MTGVPFSRTSTRTASPRSASAHAQRGTIVRTMDAVARDPAGQPRVVGVRWVAWGVFVATRAALFREGAPHVARPPPSRALGVPFAHRVAASRSLVIVGPTFMRNEMIDEEKRATAANAAATGELGEFDERAA